MTPAPQPGHVRPGCRGRLVEVTALSDRCRKAKCVECGGVREFVDESELDPGPEEVPVRGRPVRSFRRSDDLDASKGILLGWLVALAALVATAIGLYLS